MRVNDAMRLSFKNKEHLLANGQASCYHCGSWYSASTIKDWIKEDDGSATATCPRCWADCVVPGHVDKASLKEAYEHWFKKKVDDGKTS